MRNTVEKMEWLSMLNRQKEINGSDLMVAVILANSLNCKTRQCNPSIAMIVEQVSISKRSVQYSISKLERLGFIEFEKGNGRGNRTNYLLIKGADFAPIKNEIKGAKGAEINKKRVQKTTIKGAKNDNPPTPPYKEETVKETVKGNKRAVFTPPEGVSSEAANEFIQHRKNLKKPLTENAFNRAMTQALMAASELNITPDEAIHETIDAGWQGIKADWLKNRLRGKQNENSARNGDKVSATEQRNSDYNEAFETLVRQEMGSGNFQKTTAEVRIAMDSKATGAGLESGGGGMAGGSSKLYC